MLAPGNQNSVSGTVHDRPSSPRPVPAVTRVLCWTVQPGASRPSAEPVSAGDPERSTSATTGTPGSFTGATGSGPFFFPSPSLPPLCPPPSRVLAAGSSSAVSFPAVFRSAPPLGVKAVYVVSPISEEVGCGHTSVERSTGSRDAAVGAAGSSEGAFSEARPVTAASAVTTPIRE